MAGKAAKKGKAGTGRKPAAPAPDLAAAFRATYQPPVPVSNATVVLDPDVAPHFPNSRAVNDALRALLRIVRQVR